MKCFILFLVLSVSASSSAFPAFLAPQQQQQQRTTRIQHPTFLLLATKANNDDFTTSPLDPVNIDIERARDCAEHFGKCSTDEMEQLRDELHKERVQTMIFGGAASHVAPEDAFQHHLLEEELSLQLSLLHEVTPEATLFPDTTTTTTTTMAATSTATTTTTPPLVADMLLESSNDEHNRASMMLPQPPQSTTVGEKILMVEEAIVEENLGDALAICAVLAVLFAAPHLLQL